jgi:hypothetical protein
VVEHLPHHPEVNGFSPAAYAGTGRETNDENEIDNLKCYLTSNIQIWYTKFVTFACNYLTSVYVSVVDLMSKYIQNL